MRYSIFAVVALASAVFAQNCGPSYGNQICAAGKCCSQYGWCDVGAAYCDAATCLKAFSGTGSTCKGATPTTLATSKPTSTFPSKVPEIDVCGSAQGGVTCPGVGTNKYFYRCCSSAGHCGPKNDIQDQALYCGTGCQKGYGKCDTMAKPPQPTSGAGVAQAGQDCGPIVNKKCATGLCCSGSNFCGTTSDFCGAANWCQAKWGKCT